MMLVTDRQARGRPGKDRELDDWLLRLALKDHPDRERLYQTTGEILRLIDQLKEDAGQVHYC